MTKKLSPFLFAILTLIIVGFIMLLPLENILESINFTEFESEYLGLFFKMSFLFILSFKVIKKLKLNAIAGVASNYKWRHRYLNIIPFYLFVLGLLSIINKDVSEMQLSNVLVLFLGCLAVGFGEEFMFRGFLQPLFIKKFYNHQNGRFLGVFFSALFFGLFHFVNLMNSEQVLPVVIQVVFATFMGFFFGVLVLRTNKLLPLAITHGLINFFFSLQTLPNLNIIPTNNPSNEMETILAPLLIFLPLFIVGLFVIRKVNMENLQLKIQTSFTKES